MTNEILGPLASEAPPDVVRRMAERRELFRIAAQSALDHSQNGKRLSPEAREWARHWASIKPLTGGLSTGETE